MLTLHAKHICNMTELGPPSSLSLVPNFRSSGAFELRQPKRSAIARAHHPFYSTIRKMSKADEIPALSNIAEHLRKCHSPKSNTTVAADTVPNSSCGEQLDSRMSGEQAENSQLAIVQNAGAMLPSRPEHLYYFRKQIRVPNTAPFERRLFSRLWPAFRSSWRSGTAWYIPPSPVTASPPGCRVASTLLYTEATQPLMVLQQIETGADAPVCIATLTQPAVARLTPWSKYLPQ